MNWANLILSTAVIAATIAAVIFGVVAWRAMGVDMSGHGWLAFGLGAFATMGLSIGLFFLTFTSSRQGYDDIDRPGDGPHG